MSIDPITGGLDPEGKQTKPITEALNTPEIRYSVTSDGRLVDIAQLKKLQEEQKREFAKRLGPGEDLYSTTDPQTGRVTYTGLREGFEESDALKRARQGQAISLGNVADLSEEQLAEVRRNLTEIGVDPKGIDTLIEKQREQDERSAAVIAARPPSEEVVGTEEEPQHPFHARLDQFKNLDFLKAEHFQSQEYFMLTDEQLKGIEILKGRHERQMNESMEYRNAVESELEFTDGLVSATAIYDMNNILQNSGLDPQSLEMTQVVRLAAFGENEDFWRRAEEVQERSAGIAGLMEGLHSVKNTFNLLSAAFGEEEDSPEQTQGLMDAMSQGMIHQMLDPRRRRSLIREEGEDVQSGSLGGAVAYTWGMLAPDIALTLTGAGVAGTIGKKALGKTVTNQIKNNMIKGAKVRLRDKIIYEGTIGGLGASGIRTTGESITTQFSEQGQIDPGLNLVTGLGAASLDYIPIGRGIAQMRGKGAQAATEHALNRAQQRVRARLAGTPTEVAINREQNRLLAGRIADAMVVQGGLEGVTETGQGLLNALVYTDEGVISYLSSNEAHNAFLAGLIGQQPFGVVTNTIGYANDVQTLNQERRNQKLSGAVAIAVAGSVEARPGTGPGFEVPVAEVGQDGAIAEGKVRLMRAGAQPAVALTQAQLDTLSPDVTEGMDMVTVGEQIVMFDPEVVSRDSITAAADNGTLGAYVGNLVNPGIDRAKPNAGVAIVDADGNIINVMAFNEKEDDAETVWELQGRRAHLGGQFGVVLMDAVQTQNYLDGKPQVLRVDPRVAETDFFENAGGLHSETAPVGEDADGNRITLGAAPIEQQISAVLTDHDKDMGTKSTLVNESDLTQEQRDVIAAGRKVGKKVVFFDPRTPDGAPFIEGAMVDRAPDVIVLNVNKPVTGSYMDVLLHELDHHMKRDNPRLHAELMAAIGRSGYSGQWITRTGEVDLRKVFKALYASDMQGMTKEEQDSFINDLLVEAKKDGARTIAGDIQAEVARLEAEGRQEEADAIRSAVDSLRAEMTADTAANLGRRTGFYSDLNPNAGIAQRIGDYFRRKLAEYGMLGREAQIYIGAMQAQIEGMPWETMHVGTVDGGREVSSPVTPQEALDVVTGVGSPDTVTPLEELNRSLAAARGKSTSEVDELIEQINNETPFEDKTPAQLAITNQRKKYRGRAYTEESLDIRFSRGVSNGINESLRNIANNYNAARGMPVIRSDVLDVEPELHKMMADHLRDAEHAPNDPEVIEAYSAFKQETMDQFDSLIADGFTFIAHAAEGMEPYQPPVKGDPDQRSPSRKMRDQVEQEKTLVFFPTIQPGQSTFGQTTDQEFDHPLLERTGIMVATDDGGMYEMTYNDVFRVTHDVFGHAKEGSSFGMIGEENAVVQHSQMYSDRALPALIAETRMQNAFVHFGSHLRREDGSLPKHGDPDFVPVEERPFADQKVFMPPPEALQINMPVRAGDNEVTSPTLRTSLAVADKRKKITRSVLGRNMSFLTDQEIAGIKTTRLAEDIQHNLTHIFPSQSLLEKAAEMGRPMMKWYQAAHLTIEEAAAGMDMEAWRLAGLLAATSPSKSVDKSVDVALAILEARQANGGSITDQQVREAVEGASGIEADIGNSIRVLNASTEQEMNEALSGMKVTSFSQALMGDLSQVTGDTLMARAYGIYNARMGNKAEYFASTIAIRKVAEALGMEPAEAQAAIWVVSRTTSGRVSAARTAQRRAEKKGKKPTRGVAAIADTPIEASEVYRGDDIASLLAGRSRTLTTGEVRSFADRLRGLGVDTTRVDAALTEWESQNPEATPEGWKERSLTDALGLRSARRFVRNVDQSFVVQEKDPAKAGKLRPSLSIARDDVPPAFYRGGNLGNPGGYPRNTPMQYVDLDEMPAAARAFVEESGIDITDERGNPMVFFHGGSLKDGRMITSPHGAAGAGTYAASNINIASTFAKSGNIFPLIIAPTGLALHQDMASVIQHELAFGKDGRNWLTKDQIIQMASRFDHTVEGVFRGGNTTTPLAELSGRVKHQEFGGTHHPISDLLNPNTRTPLLKPILLGAGKPVGHSFQGTDGVYLSLGFQVIGDVTKKNDAVFYLQESQGDPDMIPFSGALAAIAGDVNIGSGVVSESIGSESMAFGLTAAHTTGDYARILEVRVSPNGEVVSSSDPDSFPVGSKLDMAYGQRNFQTTQRRSVQRLLGEFQQRSKESIGLLQREAPHMLADDKHFLVNQDGVRVPFDKTQNLPIEAKQGLGIGLHFTSYGGLSVNVAQVGGIRSALPGQATFGPADVQNFDGSLDYGQKANNIRASLSGPQGSMEFENDLSTRTQRALVDKFVDLQDVTQELKKRGDLTEERDVYTGIRLQNARVASQAESFAESTLQPFAQLVVEEDVDLAELEDYAYALHAKERNAQIAKRNPDMPDGGSGMTNAEADSIIADIHSRPNSMAHQELAGMLTNIQYENLQMLHDSGLITFDELVTLQTAYQHYVPLQGVADPTEAKYEEELADAVPGRPSKLAGSTSGMMRAEGRTTRAPNVLANALASKRGQVLARIEKNRTANRLLRAAETLQEPDMMQVYDKLPTRTVEGREVPDTAFAARADVVTVHLEQDTEVNGQQKKQGEVVYVQVKSPQLAGVLNQSMQEGGGVGEILIRAGNLINNFFRFTITTFAPEFMFRNLFRDVQTGVLNQAAERGLGSSIQTAKLIGKALRTTIGAEFGREGPLSDAYKAMAEGGGKQSGYAKLDIDAVAKAMKDMQRLVRKGSKTGKATRSAWKNTFGWIIDVGSGIENATRLATYQTEIDNGATPEQAALRARDVTVDFSRKGTWGAGLNALYLFFNAGAQGANRIYQAATGKRGKQVALGFAGTGMLAAMWNASFDDEDPETGMMGYDLIPEWEKRTHAIFMIPGGEGDYLKIPLPYGYHLLYNAGTAVGDVYNGNLSMGEAFERVGMTALDTFNPLSGSGVTNNFVSGVAPTVAKPMVDLATNRNFAGNRIYAEQMYGYAGPRSEQGFETTPEAFKDFASFMNRISGGNEFMEGAIDREPEVYRHIYGLLTGDIGRTVNRIVNLQDALTDEQAQEILGTSREDVPFLRMVLGTDTERDKDLVYRQIKEETQKIHVQLKDMYAAGREDLAQELYDSDPRMGEFSYIMHGGGGVPGFESGMRKIRKALRDGRALEDSKFFIPGTNIETTEVELVRAQRELRNAALRVYADILNERRGRKDED